MAQPASMFKTLPELERCEETHADSPAQVVFISRLHPKDMWVKGLYASLSRKRRLHAKTDALVINDIAMQAVAP